MDYSVAGKRVRFRGKSARVLGYLGDGKFEILDSEDTRRIVNRERMVFVK